jgi:hypothetical protein
VKVLRVFALALLASLAFGLAVGSWIRLQLEAPAHYIAD